MSAAPAPPRPASSLREARYPLPQLLEELGLERSSSNFAKEILDQMEISQMFRSRTARHGKGRKSQVS